MQPVGGKKPSGKNEKLGKKRPDKGFFISNGRKVWRPERSKKTYWAGAGARKKMVQKNNVNEAPCNNQ